MAQRISDQMRAILERCDSPAAVPALARELGIRHTTVRSYLDRAVSYGWAEKLDMDGIRYRSLRHRWASGYRKPPEKRRIRAVASVFDLARAL